MNTNIQDVAEACWTAIKSSRGSDLSAEEQILVTQSQDNTHCMVDIVRPKRKGVLGLFNHIDPEAPITTMYLSFAIKVHPEDEMFRLFELQIANPQVDPVIENFQEYHNEDDSRTPVPPADYSLLLQPLLRLFQSNPVATPAT